MLLTGEIASFAGAWWVMTDHTQERKPVDFYYNVQREMGLLKTTSIIALSFACPLWAEDASD